MKSSATGGCKIMRKNLKLLGAAALVALTSGAAPTLVQPLAAQDGDMSIHAGSVEVPVNKSQVITAARPIAPQLNSTSTSTVGFPRESRISLPTMLWIWNIATPGRFPEG